MDITDISVDQVTICPQMKRVGAMKILSVICTEYATRLQVEQLQLLHSFFAKWEPEMILKKPDDLVNGWVTIILCLGAALNSG